MHQKLIDVVLGQYRLMFTNKYTFSKKFNTWTGNLPRWAGIAQGRKPPHHQQTEE